MKTELSPLAQPYMLTILNDDIEQIEKRKQAIWDNKKSEIQAKGFRKGSVPQAVAEKQVGYTTLYAELFEEMYQKAVSEVDKKIIGVRDFIVESVEPNEPLVLQVAVDIEPKVNSVDYSQFSVEPSEVTVEPEEVDSIIKNLQNGNAELETTTEPITSGNLVDIKFSVFVNGEPLKDTVDREHQFIVGQGDLSPELETALIGASAGEDKEASITYAEDYPRKDLAGKDALFKIRIEAVQIRHLPEVNDSFAEVVGFKDLTDLKTQLEANLASDKEAQAKQLSETSILEQLSSATSMDPLPECLIKNQLSRILETYAQRAGVKDVEEYLKKAKISKEDFIRQHAASANKDVRIQLALQFVAKDKELSTSDEEVEDYLKEEALKLNKKVSELKETFSISKVKSNIEMRKAISLLIEIGKENNLKQEQ